MAVSLRMDPMLEKELALAAKRRGISKSRFIVEAVERALGRKDPYAMLLKIQAQQAAGQFGPLSAAEDSTELQYDSESSRQLMLQKFRDKYGVGSTG